MAAQDLKVGAGGGCCHTGEESRPTAGAGKISNILPIGIIFPISNICPIGNIFPIDNI
jgi:hypothetical protein